MKISANSPTKDILQDNWSLGVTNGGSIPHFGSDNQLTVIGVHSKNPSGNYYYLLHCSHCALDVELHGQAIFKSLKGNLLKGRLPCGCSPAPRWTKDQYAVLCRRAATKLGHIFCGFRGKWLGCNTLLTLQCGIDVSHGKWESSTISRLLVGKSCPTCKADKVRVDKRKSDLTMVSSFIGSGCFPTNTTFSRSSRLNGSGHSPYWMVYCPECGETGESRSNNLQKGQRPCACSSHHQQLAYINLVVGNNGTEAVKFGITNNSKQRVKQQNSKSVYEVRQYQVYIFPDVSSCKAAERECKKELETGVVLKRDMSDGYSETTWTYNLQRVIIIYKRNGGTLVWQNKTP